MKAKKGVLLWSMPRECIMEICLGYDNMIGYTEVVLVSTSCSKCSSLVSFLISSHVYDLFNFMDYMPLHYI